MLRSQIDGIAIEKIISGNFPSVAPEDKMSDAIAKMRQTGLQEIPVIDGGAYAGMVSYGSILKKKSVPMDSKVKNTAKMLPTLTKGTVITEIAEIMVKENCRQLAVLDGKRVSGLVSRRSLVEIAAKQKALGEIKIWEIMTVPVETLHESDMLQKAIDLMRLLDIRTVPIINGEYAPIGIVGMREILDNFWKDEPKSFGEFEKSSKCQITLESVCRTAVKTVEWDDTLEAAAELMISEGISTLPVVQEDELVGIVTEYDIIELLASFRQRDGLLVEISGLEEEDKVYTDSMYADIEVEVKKIAKIKVPSSYLIYVARYNETGDKKKYSLTGKMFVEGKSYSAKVVDWDLVKANNDLVKKISDMVATKKDVTMSLRRRKD